jgi:hypothetical protein
VSTGGGGSSSGAFFEQAERAMTAEAIISVRVMGDMVFLLVLIIGR